MAAFYSLWILREVSVHGEQRITNYSTSQLHQAYICDRKQPRTTADGNHFRQQLL